MPLVAVRRVQMTLGRSTAVLATCAVLSTACLGGVSVPSPSPTPTPPQTEIVIATDLPVSGDDGIDGIPAQNGARLAVEQAGSVRGIPLVLRTFDDAVKGTHDPLKGAQNVETVAADARILGLVGPLNSNVARAEIPVANKASLAMISPGNADECLTQPLPYCTDPEPRALRPTGTNNYFRVIAPDTLQAVAMADFAATDLKIKRIAIWTDGQPPGRTLADRLAAELQKKGGAVVLRQDLDPTTPDWTPFLRDAKSKDAQAIYAATKDPKACRARAQMAGIIDAAYLITSAAVGARCFSDAGTAATNVYATIAATQGSQDADKGAAETFAARFARKEDLGPYTFPSFDATRVLIDAIERAMRGGSAPPARAEVVAAVAATKAFGGAVGTYTFDPNGDPVAPMVTILRSTGREWVYLKRVATGG